MSRITGGGEKKKEKNIQPEFVVSWKERKQPLIDLVS